MALIHNLNKTIEKPVFTKLFLGAIPIVAGVMLIFINPLKLDASDLMMNAWNPAQALLRTGLIPADYPYPAWTLLLMLPFSIWSRQTTMLVWFICNILMLSASLALLIPLLERRFSPIQYGVLVLLSSTYLPVLTSMWLGQMTILSLFVLALTASMFFQKRWAWLGVMIGLSFIKPHVMLLLSGLLLVWAIWQRHWKALIAFSSTLIVLVLLSLPFISNPWQIIGSVTGNLLGFYLHNTSTIWSLLLNLGASWMIPLTISGALLFWLGWIWWSVLRVPEIDPMKAHFLFSAAILVNLIVLPYSWMHNHTLALLPLGYCLALALRMNKKLRIFWITTLFILMQPLTLGLFFATAAANYAQTFEIIPVLLLLLILIIINLQTKIASL